MQVRINLRKLKSNSFIKNNGIFFIGSLLVAFINYLYYPVLGRLLPIDAFGEVQVIISFYLQLTVFLTVLTLIATNVVVNESNRDTANAVVGEIERFALYLSMLLSVIVIALAVPLQQALKFESSMPFVAITGVFIVSVVLAFRSAYLRAKQDFWAASLQGIIAGTAKLALSALLVVIGFRTVGAIGGLLAAQIVSLYYAGRRAKKLGFSRPAQSRRLFRPVNFAVLKPFYGYAGLVLVVSLITTMMYSLDVTIVKYLFSPELAGQYASISTIARIIFFLTGSFAVVILSTVKRSADARTNYMMLVRSFIITLVLGGSTATFFALFPTFTIHLLFGQRYDQFAHLLPLLSFAMLFAALAVLVGNYHLALAHYKVLIFVLIGAGITAVAIYLSHSTIDAVVTSIFIGNFSLAAILIGWTGYRALPLLKRV